MAVTPPNNTSNSYQSPAHDLAVQADTLALKYQQNLATASNPAARASLTDAYHRDATSVQQRGVTAEMQAHPTLDGGSGAQAWQNELGAAFDQAAAASGMSTPIQTAARATVEQDANRSVVAAAAMTSNSALLSLAQAQRHGADPTTAAAAFRQVASTQQALGMASMAQLHPEMSQAQVSQAWGQALQQNWQAVAQSGNYDAPTLALAKKALDSQVSGLQNASADPAATSQ